MQMLGSPATDPVSKAAGIHTPYGFFLCDDKTLYVADEGNVVADADGKLTPDPLAGLQKWILSGTAWKLAYTLQTGLSLYQTESIAGYPASTQTYGLRNLTGQVNGDGSVQIFAVTAQYSSILSGSADPHKLVTIADQLSATTPPASAKFSVLQTAPVGAAFRGVGFAPSKKSG